MTGATKKAVLFVLLLGAVVYARGQTGGADLSGSLTDKRPAARMRDFVAVVERSFGTEAYRQESYKLIDPEGDAHLIRKLDTIPVKLLSILGGGLPQAELEKEKMRSDPFRIGKTVPIDNERLLNKCCELMRSHFPDIIPVIGEEHRWSPEAREYLKYGYWHRLSRRVAGKQSDFPCPLLGRSKLFLCLACGWTSLFCVTGKEEALKARILEYPDRSVQLHDLFEESYVLNAGDIYLTFLTCENVLAARPHRRGREGDAIQRKLSYIRHDSKENGDNYGAWYHFFGIALYGLMRNEAQAISVAGAESAGSFVLEGSDRQEYFINRYGAMFGTRFKKIIESGSWCIPAPQGCRTDYLVPNPVRG